MSHLDWKRRTGRGRGGRRFSQIGASLEEEQRSLEEELEEVLTQ
jgi:hypothetical protein